MNGATAVVLTQWKGHCLFPAMPEENDNMNKSLILLGAALGLVASSAQAQQLGGVTSNVSGALGGSLSGSLNGVGNIGGVLNSTGNIANSINTVAFGPQSITNSVSALADGSANASHS